jgi:hypothetical protein
VNDAIAQVNSQLQIRNLFNQSGLYAGEARAGFAENLQLALHSGTAHFVAHVLAH